jgi:hypothetical protein
MILIDNFELPESDIVGFDAIKIERFISETYWGYWNNDGYGFSNESSSTKITIENEEIVGYIKRVFERDGFDAVVRVTIINEQTISLLLDFSMYGEPTCCTLEIGFKPSGGGELLRNKDKVLYPVELTETIKVPIRNLPSIVNFKVLGENVASIVTASPNHYIPLVKTDDNFVDSTSRSVMAHDSAPFFTSDVEQCIELTGSIKVNASSADLGDFTVYLKSDSDIYEIDSFPLTSVLVQHTITVNHTLQVQPGEQITLYIESANSSTFQYVYDDASDGISIIKCELSAIEWRDVKAISLRSAFNSIINRASKGAISLRTYLFDSEVFDIFLTSNEGLQNKVSTINVSLFKLFDELNNKYPTSIDISGSKVDIYRRENFVKIERPYNLEVIDVTREVNSDLLYSDVKVGYNSWKADNTNFGSIEYNGTRNYESEVNGTELSMLNDWSASASEINQCLNKLQARDQTFSIVVIKNSMTAETNEYIGADVYQPDRAVNLRITPTRNLKRMAKFILTDLEFASGDGNYNFGSHDQIEGVIDENGALSSEAVIGKFKYKFSLENAELSKLKKCVSFDYCGNLVYAFMTKVTYSSGDIECEAIELV